MKIAIAGTRGIPNCYGGFEQFAERLSAGLADMGHQVWVYNPHFHPFRAETLGRVGIVRKPMPEKGFGAGANYLYDFLCLRDAIKGKADVILECGYASAAPSYSLLRLGRTRLITHMDGMEWQRAKWNPAIQRLFRRAEKKAVRFSDAIVCDHPHIQDYFRENYAVNPVCIGYGADLLESPDVKVPRQFDLAPGGYYLAVARLEPENNIRMIIEGHRAAATNLPLVIVGDFTRGYGGKIHAEFSTCKNIRFTGGIYDPPVLNNLRHFSAALFHGHSVGGTNPSLLEAMASGAGIIAHDNTFNRYILGEDASYFSSRADIKNILVQIAGTEGMEVRSKRNLKKIRETYQWESVADRYEKLFIRLMQNTR